MSNFEVVKKFKGGSMARTLLIKVDDKMVVRKIANNNEDLASEKLRKQWEWLYDFCKDNEGIFPNVSFFTVEEDISYYDMEYIELPTLRDLILKEKSYSKLTLMRYLMRGKIIADESDETVDKSYILKHHIEKMLKRCEKIKRMPIFYMDVISINGQLYRNLLPLLKQIKKDKQLLDLLTPKKLYRSHGDFTFQNILCNHGDMYVIDPRGEGNDSIYYDISKILQSCHGKYDLLYKDNYEAWLGSRELANINYKIFENEDLFDEIYKDMKKLIPEFYGDKIDKDNWELIAKFYEASHFISMVPFRLKENMAATLICYAIGVEILNEVVKEWEEIKNEKHRFNK